MFIPALMNLEERRKLAFKAKAKEAAAAATSVFFFNEPQSNKKNLILWDIMNWTQNLVAKSNKYFENCPLIALAQEITHFLWGRDTALLLDFSHTVVEFYPHDQLLRPNSAQRYFKTDLQDDQNE